MLENNEGIEINQVMNGYFVEPIKPHDDLGHVEHLYVFQTFEELVAWMRRHFTHRECIIKADPTLSDQMSSRDSYAHMDNKGNITFDTGKAKISGWKINQPEMPAEPKR